MDEKYKIVLYTFDRSEDKLLISVITKHYNNFEIVSSTHQLAEQLLDKDPKVILISCREFNESITFYYQTFNEVKNKKNCEHLFVTLINRHDEKAAFDAFKAGVIDDYLVSRPLYEVHRPVLICGHLLKELGVVTFGGKGLDYIYEEDRYSQDTRKAVSLGLESKEKLQKNFEISIQKISTAIDKAEASIKENSDAYLDVANLQQILSEIKSNHIRPELLKLQGKVINLLNSVVSDELPEPEVKKSDLLEQKAVPAHSHNKFDLEALEQKQKEKQAKTKTKAAILLIEDDPISVQCALQLMKNFDINVEAAYSGRQALACLNSTMFDIIFLDLNLPDTNGIYILDQIRKNKGPNQKSTFVLLTGNKNKNTVQKAKQLGANGYVVKPLSMDVLIKLLKQCETPVRRARK